MGYYNLIYQSGENNFLKNCESSGVDGLIIVDLPYPENKDFAFKCKKRSKISPRKILQNYKKIKKIDPKKNLVIGFGITDRTISALKAADGLVIGSMLCKNITNSLRMRQNPVTILDKVVYNLKNKIL